MTDLPGNPYIIGPVGVTKYRFFAATESALSAVNIDWGSY
jgi:hypothetical protein